MSKTNQEKSAKSVEAEAIANLLNQSFSAQGITAKAAIRQDCLQILVSGAITPPQSEAIATITNLISDLQLESIKSVKVYGLQAGDEIPDWHQEFSLADFSSELSTDKAGLPLSLNKLSKKVGEIGESISSTTSEVSKAVVENATSLGKGVGGTFSQAGKAVLETATGVGEAIGHNTSQAGKTFAKTAVNVSGGAAKKTYQLLSQVTQFAAGAPILRKMLDQVDVVKARKSIERLKEKHPEETSREIAHRIMVEKAVYGGSSGLVTSLVPGAAAALFAVDLTATAALQSEMVYQIAAAYGLDLDDSARKGEALAIFSLALGGNQAIRAALEVLQNTPLAGAVIGASTNAVMIYAVGHAACRFYEARLNEQATDETLTASQQESEEYLKEAIEQQIIMDQILVHIIKAENPGKSWQDVLPELEKANISPTSLTVIKANLQSPPSLEQLLEQLNRDFALPLLAQCQRLAQGNGATSTEELKVIDNISQRFGIDLNAMQEEIVNVQADKSVNS
ncbi:MAG: hypothetical protein WA919_08755 [Coleofasciculaceae cyanobacterium]